MRFIIIFFFMLLGISAQAQDFAQTYEQLMASGQLSKVNALFELWEQEAPDDENLYITGFNHYLTICREQRIIRPTSIDSTMQEGDALVSSEVVFNDSLFNLSTEFIDKGIQKMPTRLDLHLGKIHALWLKGDHRLQTGEILGLIDLHDDIKGAWHWGENKVAENAQELFLSSVYENVGNLFTSDMFSYVKQISERMLKSFPKELPNLSNLGATYMMEANYKKALKYFKKAHCIDEKDIIVLNNLGQTYDYMEKYEKSIKYYNLMKDYGSDKEKQYAADKIAEIRLKMSIEQ